MTSLSKSQFLQKLTGKNIDLEELIARVGQGIGQRLRRADTNGDGAVSGAHELRRLFNEVDGFDGKGSRHHLEVGTPSAPTRSGRINDAIAACAEPAALRPRRGMHGSAAPAGATAEGGAPLRRSERVSTDGMHGTSSGRRLADTAERIARTRNTYGRCAKGVNDALVRAGLNQGRGHAFEKAGQLARNPHFREVSVERHQLGQLPAGAVVVWGRSPAKRWGHVSVALGDGREASDHVSRQITDGRYGNDFGASRNPNGRNYRVFLPNA